MADDELALADGTWDTSIYGKVSVVLQSKVETIDMQGVMLISWKPLGAPSALSWQMVGNATAIDDGVSQAGSQHSAKKTKLSQENLVLCQRSSAASSHHTATTPKGMPKPKEKVEDVTWYDSVSQLGGRRIPAGQALSSATSVPAGNLGGAAINASALISAFMVDQRIFFWKPNSIEEYLGLGYRPEGLRIDGRPTINCIAFGFNLEAMVYDPHMNYQHAYWSQSLGIQRSFLLKAFLLNCSVLSFCFKLKVSSALYKLTPKEDAGDCRGSPKCLGLCALKEPGREHARSMQAGPADCTAVVPPGGEEGDADRASTGILVGEWAQAHSEDEGDEQWVRVDGGHPGGHGRDFHEHRGILRARDCLPQLPQAGPPGVWRVAGPCRS